MKPRPTTGIHALSGLFAIFLGAASAETVVIANSSESPPGGNGTYATFYVPSISNSGQVAFHSLLSGTSGGGFRGLFRGNGNGAVQIVRHGQAAPDGNGIFSSFEDPALNNNDVSVFQAQLSETTGGTADDYGVFKADGLTAPVGIAREGQPAPDNVGVFFSFGNSALNAPTLNDAGHAAFIAFIDLENGGTQEDQDGVFRGDGVTGPVQITRRGQATPSGDGSYLSFSKVTLNESGQVAFLASLTGTAGGFDDNVGVFRGDGATPPIRIVREGEPVPDGNGDFYIFSHPRMNDAGQVAFWANLRNTTGGETDPLGIFRGDGVSGPVTIARRGQTVPGGTDTFHLFGIETINNAGQVAVTVQIDLNDGGGSSDENGLILGDGTPGSLIMVVREGQPVPDGNGTISRCHHPALNNAGQLAFQAWIEKPGGGTDQGLFFFDPLEGLFQIAREDAPFLGSTLDSFIFFNSGGYNTDGRTGLNDSGEVAFQFRLDNGKRGIARWSTAPGPDIPLQITDFQMQSDPFDPWAQSHISLEWKTSSDAANFNIRYSDDLSLPPASWPLFAGPIPRDEPVTSYEDYIDPFLLPPNLFFIVEELE